LNQKNGLTLEVRKYLMSLREGAETIINQCLDVQDDEKVLVLNDSNDEELMEALLDVLSERRNARIDQLRRTGKSRG